MKSELIALLRPDGLIKLTDLSLDILADITEHLPPEDIGCLGATSTYLQKTAEADFYWRSKLKLHFPHKIIHVNSINLEKIFWENYQQEYNNIPFEKRMLFSFVKEGHVERLKSCDIKLSDLDLYDSNKITLFDWAIKKRLMLI